MPNSDETCISNIMKWLGVYDKYPKAEPVGWAIHENSRLAVYAGMSAIYAVGDSTGIITFNDKGLD